MNAWLYKLIGKLEIEQIIFTFFKICNLRHFLDIWKRYKFAFFFFLYFEKMQTREIVMKKKKKKEKEKGKKK